MYNVECGNCGFAIELTEDEFEMWIEMGQPDILCSACEDELQDSQQDRVYDEKVGK